MEDHKKTKVDHRPYIYKNQTQIQLWIQKELNSVPLTEKFLGTKISQMLRKKKFANCPNKLSLNMQMCLTFFWHI